MTTIHAYNLVADIGGTNARFAVAGADACVFEVAVLNTNQYETLQDALDAYLTQISQNTRSAIKQICMAVAAPLLADQVKLTNHNWQFSITALARQFGMPVSVINDFSAQAWKLTQLQHDELFFLQPGKHPGTGELHVGTRTIVGPGTGFGGASITVHRDVLESEPGHTSFAPLNARQLQLLQQLWQWYPRVSVEHLVSGPGLTNIHRALLALSGRSADEVSAADVVAASARGEPVAVETLELFTDIFGAVCGDIALAVGCRGGLFLSGNMLQKMGEQFDHHRFIRAFNDKGPFTDWCSEIPVAVLTTKHPGLQGCAIYAAAGLST